jgi:hypothetical protein
MCSLPVMRSTAWVAVDSRRALCCSEASEQQSQAVCAMAPTPHGLRPSCTRRTLTFIRSLVTTRGPCFPNFVILMREQ